MTTSVYSIANELDVRAPDGRRLHVYDAGSPNGELIVIHHGSPASGLLWNRWAADATRRGFHLVSYDRPGYDSSDRHAGRTVADAAADTAAIADAFGVTRFRTWGASGGGPHVLACAALLPDRIIAAATVGCVAPYDADGLDWTAGMGQENLDEFGAATAGEPALRAFLSAVAPQIAALGPAGMAQIMQSSLPPVDVAALDGELAEVSYESMARAVRQGVDGWLDDDLAFMQPWGFDPASIRVPLMLLQGRQDMLVPFTHGQWLANHIPGVTAELSDDDGHLSLVARAGDIHTWLLEH
jgi:pimeloyl-ACP methyl ester carboxylesterase